MTAVLPSARPTSAGRHRAGGRPTGPLPVSRWAAGVPGTTDAAWGPGPAWDADAHTAPLPALAADGTPLGATPPRRAGRHAAPSAPLARAARTAGLSLAALGALATGGGVATGALGSAADDPAPTGALAAPALAAQDLALRPAQAPVPQASAVLPVAVPAAAPAPVTATAAPTRTTATPAPAAAPADTASSLGEEAVAAARTKLGKPYVWGATGPNSFDCSGLTQWAYKQAGKSIPRVAAAQAGAGNKVSTSDLQPGDLVFFYSPISHVAMYVGNGMVIEAPTEGENVKLTKLSSMSSVVAARHIG